MTGEYNDLKESVFRLLPLATDLTDDADTAPDQIAQSDPSPPKNENGVPGATSDGSPTTNTGTTSAGPLGIENIVNGPDLWFCARLDNSIGYDFSQQLNGMFFFSADGDTQTLAFTYSITGADSIELTYQLANGTVNMEYLTDVKIVGNSFTAISSTQGELSCARLNNGT